ncbi:MAG: flavin reductase family protein [Saprospirales bacterium]|nr:MAG: flavin reductase family protein [Saprospirales bacterium]
MISIDPKSIATKDLHQFLLGIVAPRPIAFVSTVDENGTPNLAPYSFFNAFSSNPPIVVFSSNRRVADNTTKDTLYNIEKTGEAVINAVSYPIVRQMAVASVQYPQGVSEFKKSGLTPIASEIVRPPRVKESPAHMECKLKEIITLGEHGGAGHLIICEVVKIHLNESVVDSNNRINPHKMDLMGRMGRAYYVRASGDAIHTIYQPVLPLSVGYDALPEHVKHSPVLSGNELGILAGMEKWPEESELDALLSDADKQAIHKATEPNRLQKIHLLARKALSSNEVKKAAAILSMFE